MHTDLRLWPEWAESLLEMIRGGAGVTAAARQHGIRHPSVCGLARRDARFAAELAAARAGAPACRPGAPPCAPPARPPAIVWSEPDAAARVCPSLLAHEGDGYALVAVAVVEVAKRDMANGNRDAAAWLEQLRADVLEHAPDRLRQRVAV